MVTDVAAGTSDNYTCPPSGSCTDVAGLTPGRLFAFTAVLNTNTRSSAPSPVAQLITKR